MKPYANPQSLAEMRGPDFAGDQSFGNLGRHQPPEAWEYQGPPCRTLADMTPQEIAAIEQLYGCPVQPRTQEAPDAPAPDHASRPFCVFDGVPDPADGRARRGSEPGPGRSSKPTRTGKRKR